MTAPDIYVVVNGLAVISPTKVMAIVSERDELRCAVEAMADDLAALGRELNRLTGVLNELRRLGDAVDC